MIGQTFYPEKTKTSGLKQHRKLETGFPSPATDHYEERLNLHDYVVRYPASTFFVRVRGDDDNALGLHDGDILVVDGSLAPRNQALVVADIDGEFCVCRLVKQDRYWLLVRGNGAQTRITFDRDNLQTPIWGNVTHVVHSVD
jgi:DNA polymerase V